MKILLAVDGSPYTKRMLGYVAANEDVLGGHQEYTVLTVVPAVPPGIRSFVDTLDSYYGDEAREVLEPVKRFMSQKGWKTETEYKVGHAGDAIAERASSGDFDLLVMGSQGHSALATAVLGSVAARVVAQCKTPVLIIR